MANTIPITTLQEWLALGERIDQRQRELSQLEAMREGMREGIVSLLRSGMRAPTGWVCCEVEKRGQRRPAWKSLYLEHQAQAHGINHAIEEQRVLNDTPQGVRWELLVSLV
jgi:hypothetical protein